jgi:hypothetical protein
MCIDVNTCEATEPHTHTHTHSLSLSHTNALTHHVPNEDVEGGPPTLGHVWELDHDLSVLLCGTIEQAHAIRCIFALST